MQPEDIGYINAHGTGTPLNDVAEARAIRACFGDYADCLPVSSIKGALGHLMAASGAIEAAACVLSLQHNFLPATCHYAEPDPECEITVIGTTPRLEKVNAILSNSFGFGGQNVALILARSA
jgi:3-oxoacyl-[acyl-carrier-protein] synthase II